MTRAEAIGILAIPAVGVVLAVWLWWSLVRSRRRVPERVVFFHPPLGPGVAIPVDGDPRNIDLHPNFFRQIAVEFDVAILTQQRKEARERMTGVLDIDPPDFAAGFDRVFGKHPPSPTPSPWAEARPWAHA